MALKDRIPKNQNDSESVESWGTSTNYPDYQQRNELVKAAKERAERQAEYARKAKARQR